MYAPSSRPCFCLDSYTFSVLRSFEAIADVVRQHRVSIEHSISESRTVYAAWLKIFRSRSRRKSS